jgi:protein TonB
MRQEGMVVFRALIGTDGKIQGIVISQSSGHTLLDQSAIRVVRKWEIEPKRVAGIPVTTTVDIPVQFQMERAPEPAETAPP